MDLTTLPRTGDIATYTDANQVLDAWRKAEAMVKAFRDHETQDHIRKYRNHAMRRLGQMYLSIESKQKGGDNRGMDTVSRSEFASGLGLSKVDINKITSLANMDQLTFEMRESSDGDALWRDTVHGNNLQADRDRIKNQLQTKAEYAESRKRVDAVDRLRAAVHAEATPEEVAKAKALYVADVQEIEQAKIDAMPDVPPIKVEVTEAPVSDEQKVRAACLTIIKAHVDASKVQHKDDLFTLLDTTISKLEQIQRALQS